MRIIINIMFLFVINLVATENVTKCIFTIEDDRLKIEIEFNATDSDSVVLSTSKWAGQKNYHTNIKNLFAYEDENNRNIKIDNIDNSVWVVHNKKKKFKLKYSVYSSKKSFMGNKTKRHFHPFTSEKLSFIWMNTAILFSDNEKTNNNPVEYKIISNGKDYYTNLDLNLKDFNELRDLVIIAGELRYFKKKLGDNFVEFIINGNNWKFTDEDFIFSLMKIFKAQIDYMGINPAKTKTIVTLIEGKKNNFGGTVVKNTISLYPDPDIDISKDIALIQLVAHENFHLWNGQNLIKMDNKEFSEGYYKWFVEGFTDYYSLLTLLKEKMITTQSFINLINETIKKYYSNPYSFNLNNKELSKQYWKDHNTKKLPYSKGSLIAFLIHLNISKLSEETKKLDDFMKIIISESKNVLINDSTLLSGLKKVVKNKKWKDFYKNYILGIEELPLKELSTFGFELGISEESLFDLGFETKNGKIEKNTIVSKVIQGTNASKVGLKKGDMLKGFSIHYGNIEKEVKLNIIRNNEKLNFKYYPIKKGIITQIVKSHKNEEIIEKYLFK